MTAERTSTAAIVVIGNEILSGKITDSNSGFLARALRRAGVSLERIFVIPDDVEVISSTVAAAAAGYDLVFTSGGIGPTHDDLTIEGIAGAFQLPVVEDATLRGAIAKVAGEKAPSAAMLRMALIPEGAELVGGDGDFFPTVRVRNVYVLPGVPEIFERKVERLGERFQSTPFHLRQVFVNVYETVIAEHLNATLAAFPALLLGSYPKLSHPEYRVRLTLESKDEAYLDRALADLLGRLPPEQVVRVE
jgi:molybdenum cofactor synthesis domain-containing protein